MSSHGGKLVLWSDAAIENLLSCRLEGNDNFVEHAEDSFIAGNGNTVTSGHRLIFTGNRNRVLFGCCIQGAPVEIRCDGTCKSAPRPDSIGVPKPVAKPVARPAAAADPAVHHTLPDQVIRNTDFIQRILADAFNGMSAHAGTTTSPVMRINPLPALPLSPPSHVIKRRLEEPIARGLNLGRAVPKWALSAECDLCGNVGPLFVLAQCGHDTICQGCLVTWAKNCPGGVLTCPHCRQQVDGVTFIRAPTATRAINGGSALDQTPPPAAASAREATTTTTNKKKTPKKGRQSE